MVTFRRILVGWDGSDAADAALRMATSYADAMGASVEALAVLDGPDSAAPEGVARATRPDHEGVSSRFRTRYGEGRVPFRTVSCRTNPGEVIAQYARDGGFDLIVVGRPRPGDRVGHDHAVRALGRHATATLLVVATEQTG